MRIWHTTSTKIEGVFLVIQNNFDSIVNEFNWEKINGEYLQLFEECYSKSDKRK